KATTTRRWQISYDGIIWHCRTFGQKARAWRLQRSGLWPTVLRSRRSSGRDRIGQGSTFSAAFTPAIGEEQISSSISCNNSPTHIDRNRASPSDRRNSRPVRSKTRESQEYLCISSGQSRWPELQ